MKYTGKIRERPEALYNAVINQGRENRERRKQHEKQVGGKTAPSGRRTIKEE